MKGPTALVADDEPLLREALVRMLGTAWPMLDIVAQARNGREAIELFDLHKPDICFLDVQMPGKTGVEAAQHIGRRAHLVFVTAFDQYAVQAFAQGALDYLAFLSGWGDGTFCFNPQAEDYRKEQAGNPGYNCGFGGCAYSAYVQDWCMAGETNWCWLR